MYDGRREGSKVSRRGFLALGCCAAGLGAAGAGAARAQGGTAVRGAVVVFAFSVFGHPSPVFASWQCPDGAPPPLPPGAAPPALRAVSS